MKEDILNSYEKASLEFGYNSNSLHKLGLDARNIEEAASKQILDTLGLDSHEVIYTSGNAESFTMLLKNIRGSLFSNNENIIEIAKEMGISVINDKSLIERTTFVSSVDEMDHANHIDIDLSKRYDDLNRYDFITIEDEIPFFGVLIKKKNIDLKNLIEGGKSTTKYRSGTSVTPMIVSFSKLVRLKYNNRNDILL